MKTAVITGANEGIGYYLAKQMLADGKNVAIIDVNLDRVGELKRDYPHSLLCFVCDVRSEKDVAVCLKNTAETFGSIDYAIHNACKCSFQGISELSNSDFQEILDVNFFGAVNLTRAAIPYMEKQHSGKIYFTSSGVGVTGFHNISPYASSKGAIESFAKCMNNEYRTSGISFHLFHPPLTRTASASPLPVPDEFKADPEKVGRGLARNMDKRGFYLCHSVGQKLQTSIIYHFPLFMGKLMCKMTARSSQESAGKESRESQV